MHGDLRISLGLAAIITGGIVCNATNLAHILRRYDVRSALYFLLFTDCLITLVGEIISVVVVICFFVRGMASEVGLLSIR